MSTRTIFLSKLESWSHKGDTLSCNFPDASRCVDAQLVGVQGRQRQRLLGSQGRSLIIQANFWRRKRPLWTGFARTLRMLSNLYDDEGCRALRQAGNQHFNCLDARQIDVTLYIITNTTCASLQQHEACRHIWCHWLYLLIAVVVGSLPV